MKIPYSYIKRAYEIRPDIDSCVLYSYEPRNGLFHKALYFDSKLTTKLSNPVNLRETRLHDINMDDKPHRLQIRDQSNNIVLDLNNVYGVAADEGGGGVITSSSKTMLNLIIPDNVYSAKRYFSLDMNSNIKLGFNSGSALGMSDVVVPVVVPFDCNIVDFMLSCSGCGVDSVTPPPKCYITVSIVKLYNYSETLLDTLLFEVSNGVGSFRSGSSFNVSSVTVNENGFLKKGDCIGLYFNPVNPSISISSTVKYIRNTQISIALTETP